MRRSRSWATGIGLMLLATLLAACGQNAVGQAATTQAGVGISTSTSATSVASTTTEYGDSVTADGVTFTLDTIEQAANKTTVIYHIKAQFQGELRQTEFAAILPSGSVVIPQQTQQSNDKRVSTFTSLPASGSVTFALAPMLREILKPVDLTFPVDTQALATSRAGHVIPIGVERDVDSEQLEVTSITPERVGVFNIRVSNIEPTQSGRVMLYMPGGAATLTDDLGSPYAFLAGSTNFEKSDPLTMWAGGSDFSFAGPVPKAATELTLHVSSFAYQLRGPWRISVELPAGGN